MKTSHTYAARKRPSCLKPVSYTHLDVYKRQIYNRERVIHPSIKRYASLNQIKIKKVFVNLKTNTSTLKIYKTSLSYTFIEYLPCQVF